MASKTEMSSMDVHGVTEDSWRRAEERSPERVAIGSGFCIADEHEPCSRHSLRHNGQVTVKLRVFQDCTRRKTCFVSGYARVRVCYCGALSQFLRQIRQSQMLFIVGQTIIFCSVWAHVPSLLRLPQAGTPALCICSPCIFLNIPAPQSC